MKNDLEFCIAFIQEIEHNPALYDCTLQDYSNRRITELIWIKIGEKFNKTGKYYQLNCSTHYGTMINQGK